MRKALTALALLALAIHAKADDFIRYHPPGTVLEGFTSSDGSIVILDLDFTVDDSVFSRYLTGTSDASGNCTPGTYFVRTDTNEAWFCTSTNTWTKVRTGTVAVANGGTGLTSGTSGGVPTFTASGTITSSAALTANLPVIGGGAGAVVSVGTRSGNTTAYVTTTGTQTSGDCVSIDANGNHIASGSACGGGGGSLPVADTTSIVEGSADNTKEIRFEVDGLTTGTVRVLTPPDSNIILAGQDFANVFTGSRNTFGTAVDAANSINFGETVNRITFEGATADGFETTIGVSDPTADRTVTFTNNSCTVACAQINNNFSVSQSVTAGDLVINTGDLLIGSPATTTVGAIGITLGSTASGFVVNRTSTTPDVPSLDTSTVGRSWQMREQADSTFDFNNGPCGTAACTSPAFIIQSQNQSTTNYTGLESGAIHNRKAKALTEAGGAEQVFQITTATTQSGGGDIYYKIHATDATNYAIREGSIRFVFVNNGGTVTATISGASEAADNSILIATGGATLTYAITSDVATANVYKLMFNIDSSLTVSAAHIDYLVVYNGPSEVIH